MAKIAKDELEASVKIRIKPEIDTDALKQVIKQIESWSGEALPAFDKSIREIVTTDIDNALKFASTDQLINELYRRKAVSDFMIINSRAKGAFDVFGPCVVLQIPRSEVSL